MKNRKYIEVAIDRDSECDHPFYTVVYIGGRVVIQDCVTLEEIAIAILRASQEASTI